MRKQIKLLTILTTTLILSIGFSSCKKDDFENEQTLKKLYKTYKNGEISECKHNGQTVYSAGLNASTFAIIIITGLIFQKIIEGDL